ncbi:MAG: LytTR family DNA-binding domain-containing protein [Bacillota bacterium]
MKVNVVVEPGLCEDYAEIHVREITEEVTKLSEFMQKNNPVITGTDDNERIVVIDESDIVALHAEKKWCRIYTDTADYGCRKRLYEIENMFGVNYMRISKSIIVNLRKIESVEAVFNGMLLLRMKNGSKEYVSRTYLPKMKEYLGI